jgi:hypothetical protein
MIWFNWCPPLLLQMIQLHFIFYAPCYQTGRAAMAPANAMSELSAYDNNELRAYDITTLQASGYRLQAYGMTTLQDPG